MLDPQQLNHPKDLYQIVIEGLEGDAGRPGANQPTRSGHRQGMFLREQARMGICITHEMAM